MAIDFNSVKNRSHAWQVWAALWVVYIVWGSTYLAIRVVVETLPPLLSAGVRFLIAGGVLYAFLWFRRGRSGMRVGPREVVASAIIGTFLLFGANGMVMIAEQTVPSSLTALIISAVPLWVIMFRALTGDFVRASTLAAVGAGFAGVALLVLPGNRPEGVEAFGLFLVVFASASWATGSFLSKRVALPKDPFLSTALQMLFGGLVMTVIGLGRGELSGFELGQVSLSSLLALGYLVVFGSLLAFTAYVWLLQNAPISRVATYAYVNPVVAIFLGWAILAEPITGIVLAGAAIIVGSVAFTVGAEREKPSPALEPKPELEPEPRPALVPSEAS